MIFHLSNREIEVINCLAKGWLYKEIAADLGISFSAVHKHQYRIYRKLRVGNRTEAILKWRDSTRAGAPPEQRR